MNNANKQITIPLHLRHLTLDDLQRCSWVGSSSRITKIAQAVVANQKIQGQHFALCGPSEVPLSIGALNRIGTQKAGYIWQLVTHPALRSLGLGTLLIEGLEEQARGLGYTRTELAVEDNNTRAKKLYERLGYQPYRRELTNGDDSFWEENSTMQVWCSVMSKSLV